jgi:hypothetical protein
MTDIRDRAREHFAGEKYNTLYTAIALGRHYRHATDAVTELLAEFATQERKDAAIEAEVKAVREFVKRVEARSGSTYDAFDLLRVVFSEMFPGEDL